MSAQKFKPGDRVRDKVTGDKGVVGFYHTHSTRWVYVDWETGKFAGQLLQITENTLELYLPEVCKESKMSAQKFKIGDRVCEITTGEEGVFANYCDVPEYVWVDWDCSGRLYIREEDIELITPEPNSTQILKELLAFYDEKGFLNSVILEKAWKVVNSKGE